MLYILCLNGSIKVGFKEGAGEASDEVLQKGFNAGFRTSAASGFEKGYTRGLLRLFFYIFISRQSLTFSLAHCRVFMLHTRKRLKIASYKRK